MQKIIPHLWFDKEAKEAARFYTGLFGKNSSILHESVIEDTPSGAVDVVSFTLWGYEFASISAGPLFTFNPSISFTAVCDSKEEVDRLWAALSEGGKAMMELGEYPFSTYYGWVSDRYGLSWQIILDDGHYAYRHKITPSLLFVGDVAGRAEEAMQHYASVFPDSSLGDMARYPAGMEPDKEGTIMHGSVTLAGQEFFFMDSAHKEHAFSFNEAVSLMVRCDSQEEIDRYWSALSAVPEAEQCGWLKDKFGVSWQIVPKDMDEMMRNGTPEQKARVTKAFLSMKKFDLAALRAAYEG
jgi:predicted 3-demethylubiquinone-9 3-methyltransferase (glyoxalase superfamily)